MRNVSPYCGIIGRQNKKKKEHTINYQALKIKVFGKKDP